MQDNEPLMRALSSLINTNQPNLVLFVGEALVGNDAVDQLVKFNRALYDLAPAGTTHRHLIDGIVLTKFDTIDDKVGAARGPGAARGGAARWLLPLGRVQLPAARHALSTRATSLPRLADLLAC
jgi:signal recognition particle GTPase